jgi:cell division ATPase FtsA
MEVRLALPDVNVADECLALAQDPAYATVIGLLLKATADGSPVRVVSTPVRHVPHSVQPPVAPENSEPEDESYDKSPKEKKPKKDRGGIKKWFEGFLSEPLDGDEDF